MGTENGKGGRPDFTEAVERIRTNFDRVVDELARRAMVAVPYPGLARGEAYAETRRAVEGAAQVLVEALVEPGGSLWERLAPPDVLQAERLPASMRDYLNGGGTFGEMDGFDEDLLKEFAGELYDEVLARPPRARLEYVDECRERSTTATYVSDAASARWCAELAAAEGLALRVWDALPEDLRQYVEQMVEEWRVRLVVQSPEDWWACSSCGASFDAGQEKAVSIEGEEMPESRRLCGQCLSRALARLTEVD